VGGTHGSQVQVHGHYNLLAADGRLSDWGYWAWDVLQQLVEALGHATKEPGRPCRTFSSRKEGNQSRRALNSLPLVSSDTLTLLVC